MRGFLLTIVGLGLIGAAGAVGWTVYKGQPLAVPSLSQIKSATSTNNSVKGQVDTPGPLRSLSQKISGNLTRSGIIAQTNKERAKEGLGSLTMNETLNAAAQKKLEDMLKQQYFEHVSPQGIGPAELAQSVGYQYIRIGENLALGGFKDDPDVVTAWMNSPGHRANILRPNVTEIGVAAAQGTYEGKKVWVAVQEFGLPMSQCPTPDPKPQKTFDALQTQVVAQGNALKAAKEPIEQEQQSLKTLADSINQLAQDGNQEIADGNAEIAAGNQASQSGDQEAAQAHWTKGEQLQASGKAKLDEAQTQQNDWTTRNTALQKDQTSYNQSVDTYNQIQAQLKNLEAPINTAIKAYNACITK